MGDRGLEELQFREHGLIAIALKYPDYRLPHVFLKKSGIVQ